MGDQNEEPLMYYEEATASQHIDISTVEKMREVWSVECWRENFRLQCN